MGYFTWKFYPTLSSWTFLTDYEVFSILYLHNISTVIKIPVKIIQKISTKNPTSFKKSCLMCFSSEVTLAYLFLLFSWIPTYQENLQKWFCPQVLPQVGEPEFPLFLGSWHTSPLLEILLLSSLQASSYRVVLPSDSASWGRKTEGCEYLKCHVVLRTPIISLQWKNYSDDILPWQRKLKRSM